MTKYQFIKENKSNIKSYILIGLVPNLVYRNIEVYEYFLSVKEKSKMIKYEFTSEHFNLSPNQIRNIVNDFETEIYLK